MNKRRQAYLMLTWIGLAACAPAPSTSNDGSEDKDDEATSEGSGGAVEQEPTFEATGGGSGGYGDSSGGRLGAGGRVADSAGGSGGAHQLSYTQQAAEFYCPAVCDGSSDAAACSDANGDGVPGNGDDCVEHCYEYFAIVARDCKAEVLPFVDCAREYPSVLDIYCNGDQPVLVDVTSCAAEYTTMQACLAER